MHFHNSFIITDSQRCFRTPSQLLVVPQCWRAPGDPLRFKCLNPCTSPLFVRSCKCTYVVCSFSKPNANKVTSGGHLWYAWPARSPDFMTLIFFFIGGMWRVSCTPPQLTPERNWLCEYTLLLKKFNTDLKCSTESNNHCYDGVMNVNRFRVGTLNTFCKLSPKVLEEIDK
jgi:hypothetical protein